MQGAGAVLPDALDGIAGSEYLRGSIGSPSD